MFNFNYSTEKGIKWHNPNCPGIPGHPCRILIIGGSGPGKNKCIA